jgi:hypothetical protein
VTITVSYAGQDATPKPFRMIINWIGVENDWKVASEIILPVPSPVAEISSNLVWCDDEVEAGRSVAHV